MKKKSVIISLISLGLFIILTILMLMGLTKSFDTSIYNLVRSLKCNFFDNYFMFITKFGNVSTILILLIVCLLIFKNKERLMFFIIPMVCVVSNQLIKFMVRRDRPSVLRLIEESGYSYPSGHSMISVSLYGLFIYLVFTKVENKFLKYGLCSILSLLILSIGISRIYVGVHYASDVLGGFLLSFSELILLINFVKTYGGQKNV